MIKPKTIETIIERGALQSLVYFKKIDVFSIQIESDDLLVFFLQTIIFKAQNHAFAPFHRPRNSTCRTAGYTPLHYIIVFKYNKPKESQSRTKRAAVWPPLPHIMLQFLLNSFLLDLRTCNFWNKLELHEDFGTF